MAWWHRPGRGSLMRRLVATFGALSVAMVAIVAGVAYVRARSELQHSIYSRLDAAQALSQESLASFLDNQKRNVVFASGLLGGRERNGTLPGAKGSVARLLNPRSSPAAQREASRAVRRTLAYAVGQTSDAQELLVVDHRGRVVVSSVRDHDGLDLSNEPFVVNGSSTTYVQPVRNSPLTGGPEIVVATPLFDDTGRGRGVLAAVLDLGRLDQTVLQRTGIGDGGQTYLVDQAHHILGTRGNAHTQVRSSGIDLALGGHSGRATYSDSTGTPVLGAYAWVPTLGVALLSELGQREAFAPARQLAWVIGGVGAAVVTVLVCLIYVASRRLASPILDITRAAEAVRAGDLTREAPVRTTDEVGTLATTFNEMTATMRAHVDELEQRVEDRTAELRTQKRYFETLVEISPAAVVTMDPARVRLGTGGHTDVRLHRGGGDRATRGRPGGRRRGDADRRRSRR